MVTGCFKIVSGSHLQSRGNSNEPDIAPASGAKRGKMPAGVSRMQVILKFVSVSDSGA